MRFGYEEDLAFVHDAGFAGPAEAAARMVVELAPRTGLVADLGCGSGILAGQLVEAGFGAWGVDLSPAMVTLARRRVPEATFEVGDAMGVQIPACVAVTAVGEVLNYGFVDHSLRDVSVLFHRIYQALAPGGLFLFDVATPGRAGDGPTHAERSGQGWRVEAKAEERNGWLTRTIQTWRTVDGTERHTQEVHRLRLMDADWILAQLRAAGFQAEPLGGYDDFGFQHGWDGFLARKA